MQPWIVAAIVSFVVRQLGKFGTDTDWDKVKADAQTRVHDLVPHWLEGTATGLVSGTIDVIKLALESTNDLQNVADKVASGDLKGAVDLLLDLVKRVTTQRNQHLALTGLVTLQKSLVDAPLNLGH